MKRLLRRTLSLKFEEYCSQHKLAFTSRQPLLAASRKDGLADHLPRVCHHVWVPIHGLVCVTFGRKPFTFECFKCYSIEAVGSLKEQLRLVS